MSIRVVVVDDSVVIRRLVVQALESDSGIEVIATAANGKLGLAKIEQLKPDAITMDIEMPEMNGVEAVRALRKKGIQTPIIMFSTLTERGATATLDALTAGASDYVTKPSNVGSINESLRVVAGELIPKIKALVPHKATSRGGAPGRPGAPGAGGPASTATAHAMFRQSSVNTRTDERQHAIRAVVLGSSTGGPEALSKVIASLNQPLPVPMIVTQHMPPVFTKQLAARLDRLGPNRVHEAHNRQLLQPANIYLAPGDYHLELAYRDNGVYTTLTQGPPVNFCRPSVDVMFASAQKIFGPELLSVILTGMGSDGKNGAGHIAEAGGTVIVQDQGTSVVWGMPGATATAGYAHRILPINEIGPTVQAILARTKAVQPLNRGGAS
ncbi:protein-glutamate methylesterase/protein-glutamine glutaminase [Jonesia quinghaiensis]|uniref:protein-glutamate methylesterase/protein-glutamine glutaminase n=1 Tax=Jonesia quinghaiensis TaxID=262806 RepID=UPI00049154E7|nr:chemotaxis response regulator protein-glutamate methylesterase [Jonesia quinghaiensis]